ncbi:MAG TPA: hypothetical protein PKD55_04010, partial [Bellilinea sp.]|nr:hypothetical protein [Bellilinea sp.]
MPISNQIILSQLTPPAQHSDILKRKRVANLLSQSLYYPLTLIIAGTGYSKSTSILSFIETLKTPVFWYSVSQSDHDPVLFLANLCAAFNMNGYKLGQTALQSLEDKDTNRVEVLTSLVNALAAANLGTSVLVLDDFQNASVSQEIVRLMDWFVDHLPRSLHVIIASRTPIDFPSLSTWRVKNRALVIGREQLLFTSSETSDLFTGTYGLSLNEAETSALHDRTEGWAIGLQVVWQSLRSRPERDVRAVLNSSQLATRDLFAYLAEEVLEKLPADQRDFLIQTSVLSILESDICDFLLNIHNSLDMLTEFYRQGLFIESLGPNLFRYHNIFREFLLDRLNQSPEVASALHRKAASYYAASHTWEQAVSHMMEAGDFQQVARVISDIGDRMIAEGRLESLQKWISQIPTSVLRQFPYLYYLSGSVERLSSRFDQALEQYRTARQLYHTRKNTWGESLSLRGQAQVYLDTIRPANAKQLLTKAVDLLNANEQPDEAAALLTQLAENQINQGDPVAAKESLSKARKLVKNPSGEQEYIEARILLRTGQLEEGIRLLKTLGGPTGEANALRPQRFHRETTLLLSLFYAFTGQIDESLRYANMGLVLSRQLRSSFISAVGQMRLGHATQLEPVSGFMNDCLETVTSYYEQAMQSVSIVRIHVEPLWGLVRLVGYAGRIDEAQAIAKNALSIAAEAGDKWIAMIIHISLGAALALHGLYEAANKELSLAESLSRETQDTFAECAASLWLAYTAWKQNFTSSFELYMDQTLTLVDAHGYNFLFTRPTILGANDPALFLPLLIDAKQISGHSNSAADLLNELTLVNRAYHPGFALKIRTLGRFEVRLGAKPLEGDSWKREKARQMLQILSVAGEKGMTREQICLILWPDASPQEAANNFKVTLSALNQSLEPDRPSGVPA